MTMPIWLMFLSVANVMNSMWTTYKRTNKKTSWKVVARINKRKTKLTFFIRMDGWHCFCDCHKRQWLTWEMAVSGRALPNKKGINMNFSFWYFCYGLCLMAYRSWFLNIIIIIIIYQTLSRYAVAFAQESLSQQIHRMYTSFADCRKKPLECRKYIYLQQRR